MIRDLALIALSIPAAFLIAFLGTLALLTVTV